jgi:hypothetical protein
MPELGTVRRRPTEDQRVLELRERYGLAPDASIVDTEAVAVELMRSADFADGMALVLGRHLEKRDVLMDRDLGGLAVGGLGGEPEKAFAGLLVLMAIEELAIERQAEKHS